MLYYQFSQPTILLFKVKPQLLINDIIKKALS